METPLRQGTCLSRSQLRAVGVTASLGAGIYPAEGSAMYGQPAPRNVSLRLELGTSRGEVYAVKGHLILPTRGIRKFTRGWAEEFLNVHHGTTSRL
jgi:hypothetical protein